MTEPVQTPANLRLARSVLLGVVVSFAIQAVFVLIWPSVLIATSGLGEASLLWSLMVSFGPLMVSSITGYVIVVRALRRFRVIAALIYFPVAWYCLVVFSLFLGGAVHGAL